MILLQTFVWIVDLKVRELFNLEAPGTEEKAAKEKASGEKAGKSTKEKQAKEKAGAAPAAE